MRRHVTHPLTALACAAVTAILVATAYAPLSAQRGKKAVLQPAPGVYTEAQSDRGAALYVDNCQYCHLVDLSGGDLAPALIGASFVAKWTTRPLGAVFDYMRVQMPLNSPGGLNAQQNADIIAFLLKKSGFPAGASELPGQSDALKTVTPPRP